MYVILYIIQKEMQFTTQVSLKGFFSDLNLVFIGRCYLKTYIELWKKIGNYINPIIKY